VRHDSPDVRPPSPLSDIIECRIGSSTSPTITSRIYKEIKRQRHRAFGRSSRLATTPKSRAPVLNCLEDRGERLSASARRSNRSAIRVAHASRYARAEERLPAAHALSARHAEIYLNVNLA